MKTSIVVFATIKGEAMLAVKPGRFTTKDVKDLAPGELFVHNDRLCVALEREDENILWMRLTGAKPFELHSIKRSGLLVTVIPVDPSKLMLRFDPAKTSTDGALTPGRIVVERDGHGFLQGYWPSLEGKDYRNGCSLVDWSHQVIDMPHVAFCEWSLSVLNPDGSWFDFVRYNESKKSVSVAPLQI